jgi:hypothetical protein
MLRFLGASPESAWISESLRSVHCDTDVKADVSPLLITTPAPAAHAPAVAAAEQSAANG